MPPTVLGHTKGKSFSFCLKEANRSCIWATAKGLAVAKKRWAVRNLLKPHVEADPMRLCCTWKTEYLQCIIRGNFLQNSYFIELLQFLLALQLGPCVGPCVELAPGSSLCLNLDGWLAGSQDHDCSPVSDWILCSNNGCMLASVKCDFAVMNVEALLPDEDISGSWKDLFSWAPGAPASDWIMLANLSIWLETRLWHSRWSCIPDEMVMIRCSWFQNTWLWWGLACITWGWKWHPNFTQLCIHHLHRRRDLVIWKLSTSLLWYGMGILCTGCMAGG